MLFRSLAPHERLTELPVLLREKPHTSATARENLRDALLLSHLGSPMEAEPLPEKHKPVLSRTGHNTQAFTPQSHSQIASSIFKKAYDAKTYTRSRDQGPSSLSL